MSDETLQNIDILSFQTDLLHWYQQNKRVLPWRQDQNPYKIWVSEIMLQQTRVDTVIPYFERFMTLYPTVHHLAEADSQEVLKAWEGLGYYSRARNLHAAVREVVATYDGVVPKKPDQLGALKGIGPYTQGAIMSIAFNQPEPAVDGNVMRVLSRILLVTENVSEYRVRKKFERYVRELISHQDPASFNQGLMELGALICTPTNPACENCPVQTHCAAYHAGVEQQLPVKSKAKKQRTTPYIILLLSNDKDEYVIEQRPETGLLADLWQFLMIPTNKVHFDEIADWIKQTYGLTISVGEQIETFKHVFSHLIWDITVYRAHLMAHDVENDDGKYKLVHYKGLSSYPFSVPHLKVKKHLKIDHYF